MARDTVDSMTAIAPTEPPPPDLAEGDTSTLSRTCTTLWPEVVVTLSSLLLFGWNLSQNGTGNAFYAASVRSMSRSWSNFFYASLDPGGWITVDKPPAALWLQALSVRIFGFGSWQVLLPGVLCGGLAVWVLMATIRRPWGRTAGVVSGIALALTPVIVATSRSNNPDITLVLTVVLAAWATMRGIEDGRTRWMALAGLFCGVGFLTKLLAAGLVMPGLWGAYLLAAPGSWKKRAAQCFAGALVFFVVCVAWVGAVDVRPVADRPWIGGSTDGSARDLVFGYNGFGRVTGAAEGPGGGGALGGNRIDGGSGAFGAGGFGGGANGINQFGGSTGALRLFNAGMGDQVMWLFPVTMVAALAAIASAIRRRRRDAQLGSAVMWLGWTVVVYALFAFASGIFHNYYVSLLAPALAALVGIGAELARRSGKWGWCAAAATLMGTAVLQVVLMNRVDADTWLRAVVPIGVAAAAVGVLVGAVSSGPRRAVLGSLGLGGVVLLLAPAVWSVAGVRTPQNSTFPDARPVAANARDAGGFGAGPGGFGGGGPGGPGGGGSLPAAELKWLRAQRHGETWIVGVSSSMEADAAIIAGEDVVALGGFSGGDNSASPANVARLVAAGKLRFLAVAGRGGFGGFGGGGLSGAVSSACVEVPATNWGDTATSSGVYDCQGKAAALKNARTATRGVTDPFGGAPPGGGGGQDLAAMQKCLAEAGVSVSRDQVPDLADPKLAEAMRQCLPTGAVPGGGPPGGVAPK